MEGVAQGRVVTRRMLQGVALAVGLGAAAAMAQSAAPASFHLVQRIDETLVGVDPVALDVLGRDHVAGTYFLVHAKQPTPLIGYANYVVDCRPPLRIATVNAVMPSGRLEPATPFEQPPRRTGAVDLTVLRFTPVQVMDGTRMVAEFSCRASSAPGRARQIAQELAEQGGPPDSTRLYCALQPDAGGTPRPVEVRFSPAEDVVAVNGQWLSSGFLVGDEVVFGSGAQWRIDRGTRVARLVRDDGVVLHTGSCDSRPPGR